MKETNQQKTSEQMKTKRRSKQMGGRNSSKKNFSISIG
jgi:hypothetical protein